MPGNRPRVVITGMGAISPLGIGVDAFWEACLAGRSGIERLQAFDPSDLACQIAGEVRNFTPTDHMARKDARRMARFSQFAVAGAAQAFEDANLDLGTEDRTRIGVVLGNGIGGLPNIQAGVLYMQERGAMRLDPLLIPRVLPNMAASNVSMQFGLLGYNSTIVTACAAGTQAIGEAAELIRRETADVVVSGGTEAAMVEVMAGSFAVMRALSSRNDAPQRASRPFDADRDGFVPAEGAGILVLESEAHARARGAHIRAEVAGFGASADAYHLVAPDESGDGPVRAVIAALHDAGTGPGEVDYVNAHGTSTPLNDVSETKALKTALGKDAYRVAISATKSMIGHGFGAGGALESIAAVRSIETGRIHPTVNLETPDPACDLDYVPGTAREAKVDVVLKNSFGFGGQNACLVLRRYEEEQRR